MRFCWLWPQIKGICIEDKANYWVPLKEVWVVESDDIYSRFRIGRPRIHHDDRKRQRRKRRRKVSVTQLSHRGGGGWGPGNSLEYDERNISKRERSKFAGNYLRINDWGRNRFRFRWQKHNGWNQEHKNKIKCNLTIRSVWNVNKVLSLVFAEMTERQTTANCLRWHFPLFSLHHFFSPPPLVDFFYKNYFKNIVNYLN